MAKQKTEDALLKTLYGNYYQDDVEALCHKCGLDRNTIVDGLKSLSKHNYVTQMELNRYAITRLGIYYVEMNRLVSGVRIEADEKTQLLILDGVDAAKTADDAAPAADPLRDDEDCMKANTHLLLTHGLIHQNNDGSLSITTEGMNHLKYLRSKYNVAPPPVLVAPKPVRRRTVKTAAPAAAAAEEPVAVGAK